MTSDIPGEEFAQDKAVADGSPARPAGRAEHGFGPGGATVLSAGVRLRPGGRSVSCDAGDLALWVGATVVIQSERGHELGVVTVAPACRPTRARLPRILRIANERDLERGRSDDRKSSDAVGIARESVRGLGLDIKVFHAEVHGGGRVVLFFASEARVDFRELVRELSNRLRARVELRQVGVRDEAKMVGGIGSCGRELCCSTFLPRFAPVSIKAAKNQNLALTPSKVSGQCGRLKCCLVYEEAVYVEAAKKLPRIGKRVETPDGLGKVVDLDILRGRVRVIYENAPPRVFEASDLRPANANPAAAAPAASAAAVGEAQTPRSSPAGPGLPAEEGKARGSREPPKT